MFLLHLRSRIHSSPSDNDLTIENSEFSDNGYFGSGQHHNAYKWHECYLSQQLLAQLAFAEL